MESIFINDKAKNINDVLSNDWVLEKLHKNIYSIKNTNWLVKVYSDVHHAKNEAYNLSKLKLTSGKSTSGKLTKGIPTILATSFSKDFPFVILSKLEGIDVYEYMKIHGTFTENKLRLITIQILKILKKVHKKGIIHKDIKPENILITDKHKISIIDFEGRCTINFLSPEQVNREKLSSKTDMWSLGVSLYKMLTNLKLFKNKKEILNKKIEFPDDWSLELKDFLYCLLDRDKKSRFNVDDALDHAWINI
jgi:serine/threonine protein kinase